MKAARSPAREALAKAIEVRVDAASEATRATETLHRFNKLFDETRRALYQAQTATEAARAHRRDLYQANGGNDEAVAKAAVRYGERHPNEAIADAVKVEAFAQEKVQDGRAGQRSIMAAAGVADDDLTYADKQVLQARERVKHELATSALTKATASLRQFERDRSVLQFLARDLDGVTSNTGNATGLAADIRSMLGSPINIVIPPEWLAADEALLCNPDAAFPEFKN